jgi:hypothetical protein
MQAMFRGLALGALVGLTLAGAAWSAGDQIVIGEWRTEAKKSLVCGGEEGNTLVDIAKRANAFYLSGGQKGSPEYEAYWSFLEKAMKERRCFVTEQMKHLPDELVYAGPEELDKTNNRFKVLGTTIDENGSKYPAFTMTTLSVLQQ